MSRSRVLALPVVAVVLALSGCSSGSGAPAAGAARVVQPAASGSASPTRSPLARGLLPALSPRTTSPPAWTGDSVRVVLPGRSSAVVALRGRVREDGVERGEVRLVVRSGHRTARAPVPAGWPPAVLPVPVETGGRDRFGIVVSQEGGDSDAWTVYLWSAGRLVAARRGSAVPLGGGFAPDGMRAYRSWISKAGLLYTRLGVRGPRFRVWRWRVAGTVLRSTALGTVCLDADAGQETYVRC